MDHSDGAVKSGGPPLTLTHEQIARRLREVDLFQGLSHEQLTQILRISEGVRVDRGEYVFEEGDRGDHFFVIVHGAVEMLKTTGSGLRTLNHLRAGESFGEMALLNRTPRSASALASEDTYLLTVSREAFGRMLGGDTLSVKLLRNLSKALWEASVRLASHRDADQQPEERRQSLAEFNGLLRARLLPRVTPRVKGYDFAATTQAHRGGAACSAWDWFVLADGRPSFVVLKATRCDVFAAQRLAGVRMLLRSAAAERHATLGALLTRVARGLRAGWIESLSGPVMVGIAALADGVAEWGEAGPVSALVSRRSRREETLEANAPPLGQAADWTYRSRMVELFDGDRLACVTDVRPEAGRIVAAALFGGHPAESRDALALVMSRLEEASEPDAEGTDLSGILIRRTEMEV